jgi:ABC-type ATPase with predicted acetyltransferase domain
VSARKQTPDVLSNAELAKPAKVSHWWRCTRCGHERQWVMPGVCNKCGTDGMWLEIDGPTPAAPMSLETDQQDFVERNVRLYIEETLESYIKATARG